jgi:UDP-glucose 4-epimerase
LLRRGHRVRVVDSLVTGYQRNLRDGVEFEQGDLADPAVAKAAVAGMDYVIHQAAIPSVPRSVEKPEESHRANIDATLQVLLASRAARIKRVVFAGSSSVYGDTEVLPKTEVMPTNPLSPYALQKLMGEMYLQMFTKLYGLETVTTRYFNVFGPRQDPGSPYSGVISLFIKALSEGTPPLIYGDGEQTRDFTYVANVVDAVLRAADTPGVGGQVFNVATNSRISLNQLLATLKKIFGSTVEPIYEPARKGDIHDSQADISKAARLLGYQPLVGLEEGLRKTVDWYRNSTG